MQTFSIPHKQKAVRWYQEPWILLVIGGPLLVVCASLYTAVLAYRGADNVLSEDYYRRGLQINKDIHRDQAASTRKIGADMALDTSTGALTLKLQGRGAMPSVLLLSLARASGSTIERMNTYRLVQSAPGQYSGKIDVPATEAVGALWHVKVEAPDWRLAADWFDPARATLKMKAAR